MSWQPDPYYRDCIRIIDENGNVIPKHIEMPKDIVYVWNEWYYDELLPVPDSIEDMLIDNIDNPKEDTELHFEFKGKKIKQFDMYELISKVLSPIEQKIFYMHYVDDISFREMGKELGKGHTQIFAVYQRCFVKLRSYIEKNLLV